MSNKIKINFIGFLANVDSTITKINFENGFKIKSISIPKGVQLLSKLGSISTKESQRKLGTNLIFNNSENKIFFIENSFDYDNKTKEDFFTIISRLNKEFIRGYLQPVLGVMRLFKEGNVCMPLNFFYIIKNDKFEITMGNWRKSPIIPGTFSLEKDEIIKLQDFIKKTKLPFKYDYIQFAFDNYQLTYKISNQNLAFLSLIIGLESLFNPGEYELTYQISRNASVLLGSKDEIDSNIVFLDIKKFYEKRSKLVHFGEKIKISEKDFKKLRNYVRESIKITNKLNKSKNELKKLLTSSGFNEKILEK